MIKYILTAMTTVYEKGGSGAAMNVKFYQWESLPNVGLEAQTYLYHMITNYHHLLNSLFLCKEASRKISCGVYIYCNNNVEEAKRKGFHFNVISP